MSPKISPKAPQEGHYMEKKYCSDPQKEHQERLNKISHNILKDSQKVDVICQNRSQNTLKQPPEDGDMMSKKSISDNQSFGKNT